MDSQPPDSVEQPAPSEARTEGAELPRPAVELAIEMSRQQQEALKAMTRVGQPAAALAAAVGTSRISFPELPIASLAASEKIRESIANLTAATAAVSRMPGLDKLAESAHALDRVKLADLTGYEMPHVERVREDLLLHMPVGATRDDVAAVTEAVIALHGAVLEQSKFQAEQSKRQDRMDRRFFVLEVVVGAITVALAVAAIVYG
jgi:hypothetical protein